MSNDSHGSGIAAMLGRLDQTSYRYLIANAIGSAALTGTAIVTREWGFILLEGVWSLVSLFGVVRKAIGKPVAVGH